MIYPIFDMEIKTLITPKYGKICAFTVIIISNRSYSFLSGLWEELWMKEGINARANSRQNKKWATA